MSVKIESIFEPTDEIIEGIYDGLTQFNLEKVGGWECHHIAVVARKGDKIIGGINGTAQWNWLDIEQLWVEVLERNQGLGSRLLDTIEQAAAAKGFPNFHIRTGDWQALEFYKKHGYKIFGELENHPEGHTLFFLKKLG